MSNTSENQQLIQERSRIGGQIHTPYCFCCGKENPKGLQEDFPYDPATQWVHFWLNLAKEYGNTSATIHGGIAYSVLDEAMGSLCFHLGYPVMTKEMTIRYHKALPIDQAVYVKGWITDEDKRYFFTQGYIASSDNEAQKEKHIYAESHAQFTKLPPRFFSKYFAPEGLKRFAEQMKVNLAAGKKERGLA